MSHWKPELVWFIPHRHTAWTIILSARTIISPVKVLLMAIRSLVCVRVAQIVTCPF